MMRSQVETPGQGGEEQLRLPPVGGQRRRSTSSPDPILNIPEEAKTLYRNLSFTTESFSLKICAEMFQTFPKKYLQLDYKVICAKLKYSGYE